MRRREKFVILSILLGIGLLVVQYVPIDYRYYAVAVFTIVTYLISALALSDDLQAYEWITILPFPTLYSASVGLFYFLLPEGLISRLTILVLFGVGMYAIFLISNIYSVAKGRTIQLMHAASAVALIYDLLISVLFLNTIFSLKLPFYFNTLLVFVSHFPLVFISLWSVKLTRTISKEIWIFSFLISLLLSELALCFSFYPLSVWNVSLFIMTFLYISLGVIHSYLKSRLFANIIREYSLVAILAVILFIVILPLK